MPKYHKLNSSHESLIPGSPTPTPLPLPQTLIGEQHTTASKIDDYNDDDEEEFPLFLNGHGNHHTRITAMATTTMVSHDANERFHPAFDEHHQLKNNNSNNNDNIIITAIDADDSTMEVPLLNNNNASEFHTRKDYQRRQHEHAHEHTEYQHNFDASMCQCELPGFGANLRNKSTQDAKFKILLAISLCGVFMIIEFLGGYFAGSLAIMTDAAHLASDCISFVIGLVAISLGSRPPDQRMSFGYKRMEVIGALISILGIWILTATLVMVAIQRIYSNDYDLNANTMMTISAIGILINIVMIFVLHGSAFMPGGSHGHSHAHGHSHSHAISPGHGRSQAPAHGQAAATTTGSHVYTDVLTTEIPADGNISVAIGNGMKRPAQHNGHHHNDVSFHDHHHNAHPESNVNLRAAVIHVIGDLVQSIGVFLASVLIKFVPSAKFADPLCTLLFSVIVVMTTVRLFKESVLVVMDAVPKHIALEELETDLAQLDGVKSVHHLNVWSHTTDYTVLMVHLVVDLLTDSNTVLKKATQLAASNKYNIKHCTIQIERVTV